MLGVSSTFDQFIFEYDCCDKAQDEISSDLLRILKLRFKNNMPSRPPRVLILGPPGCGKNTQAKYLEKSLGLVRISIKDLLKNEISGPDGQEIAEALDKGQPVSDLILNHIVEKRLKQSDVKVNGFVMEGFPNSKVHCNLLKQMKIRPSQVFIFDSSEDECIRRLANRRVDPETGMIYDM